MFWGRVTGSRGQGFEFSSISCRGPRRSACGLWPFLDILATPSNTLPQIYRTTTPASPFHRPSCTPLCPACHIHLPRNLGRIRREQAAGVKLVANEVGGG